MSDGWLVGTVILAILTTKKSGIGSSVVDAHSTCRSLVGSERIEVCSNEKSPFDGKAVFEHDGCEEFANNPEGWAPPV